MSSGQQSLISYFKRKGNVEESNNNSTKKSKINDNLNDIVNDNFNDIVNDNFNDIVNDNLNDIHAPTNTEPSCRIQSNINQNRSLSTTMITTTNDNKKPAYHTWYSKDYKWLLYEPNKGGFCCICRDYWKLTTPFYSEMNARTKGVFTT
jgi:hypothetical protein